MRLLVTRPDPDAEALAERLRGLGHQVLIAPMLTVVPREEQAIDLAGVQVICFTSRNAVRIFADQSPERAIPVYVVGPGTAEEARAKGFLAVREGGGDGRALVEAVRDALSPLAGAVLHARGAAVAYDVVGALRKAGFTVREQVLYETLPVPALAPEVRQAWAEGHIDGVLLFSPRSAKTFATLLMDADLAGGAKQVIAYCLSDAVRSGADLPWQAVRVAERPDVPAMIELLEGGLEGGKGAMAEERKPDQQPKPAEVAKEPPKAPSESPAPSGAASPTPSTSPSTTASTTASTGGPSKPPAPQGAAPASPPGQQSGQQQDERGNVEAIIAKFGGLRPMANKLDLAVSTVQGWKIRGHIPEQRHAEVLKAAKEHNIAVSAADLLPPGEAAGDAPTEPAPSDPAPAAAAQAKGAEAKARSPLPATGQRPGADGKEDAAKPPAPSEAAKAAEKADEKPKEATATAQAAPPAAAAHAAPEAAQRRGGGFLPGLLVGALLIVGGAVAAVALRDSWMPLVAGTQTPAGDTSQLQQQVQSLASELDTVKQQTAALSQKADSLESSISGLSGQQGGSPADITALQSSVQSLQAAGEKRAQDLASIDSALKAITGDGGLESKVSDLTSKADGLAVATARNEAGVANLTNEVRTVSGQVAGLGVDDLRSSTAALSTKLDSLDTRLNTVEGQVRGQVAAERNAMLLALGQLDDAVAAGQPYAQSLSLMSSYADDRAPAAAMATLQSHATSGVTTLSALRVRFKDTGDAIVAADYDATADEGLFGDVVRNLSKLVIVRSRDPNDPGANGVVARSEAALEAGNLAGAVSEVESLEGPPAQVAASWLADAKARLAVDSALTALAKAFDATDAAPRASAAASKNSAPAPDSTQDGGAQDTSAAPAADDASTAAAPATDDAATTTAPATDDAATTATPATDDAASTDGTQDASAPPAEDDAATTNAPANDDTAATTAAPAADDAATTSAAPVTDDTAATTSAAPAAAPASGDATTTTPAADDTQGTAAAPANDDAAADGDASSN